MIRSFQHSLIAVVFAMSALAACASRCEAATAAAPTHAVPAATPARMTPAPMTPAETAVRKAMDTIAKGVKIDSVQPAPIAGFLEVNAEGQTVYFSDDGKYMISGSIIDVASKRNLTETSRAILREGLLKNITASQMIVFAPPHPKYTVTVFTDVDCGYCRKLHSQIADYNKAGIAVDYLFFPRDGIGTESYDKAVSVWCASDRRQALTDAKKGMPVKKSNCSNPVTMDYNLGLRVGVDGTPAIYAADGTQLGGYLTPAEMKSKLDELAAKPNS